MATKTPTKYNIIQFIMNTAGQYSASVSATFDALESAKVNYHTTLANLHNAPDVLRATVKIEDEYGFEVMGFIEVIDHTVEEES